MNTVGAGKTARFVPSPEDLPDLRLAAVILKESQAQANAAQKRVEAAKESLAKWLKETREVDLDACEVGQVALIEGVALIEINGQRKFDAKAFSLEDPATHAMWLRDVPVKKFKALV